MLGDGWNAIKTATKVGKTGFPAVGLLCFAPEDDGKLVVTTNASVWRDFKSLQKWVLEARNQTMDQSYRRSIEELQTLILQHGGVKKSKGKAASDEDLEKAWEEAGDAGVVAAWEKICANHLRPTFKSPRTFSLPNVSVALPFKTGDRAPRARCRRCRTIFRFPALVSSQDGDKEHDEFEGRPFSKRAFVRRSIRLLSLEVLSSNRIVETVAATPPQTDRPPRDPSKESVAITLAQGSGTKGGLLLFEINLQVKSFKTTWDLVIL